MWVKMPFLGYLVIPLSDMISLSLAVFLGPIWLYCRLCFTARTRLMYEVRVLFLYSGKDLYYTCYQHLWQFHTHYFGFFIYYYIGSKLNRLFFFHGNLTFIILYGNLITRDHVILCGCLANFNFTFHHGRSRPRPFLWGPTRFYYGRSRSRHFLSWYFEIISCLGF